MKPDDALYSIYANNKDKVVAEQCFLLHNVAPFPLIVSLANALVLVAVLWSEISHTTLLYWLGAIILITAMRGTMYLAFKKADPETADHALWIRTFILLVTLSAIAWGSTAILFLPVFDTGRDNWAVQEFLLLIILGGNAAGSISSLSYNLLAVRTFLIVTLLPACVILIFFDSHELATVLGILILLYTAVLTVNAGYIYTNTTQNILLRIKSELDENAKALLENAHEGILINAGGKHVYVNQKLTQMLGYENDELIGTVVEDVVHPDELETVKSHHKKPGEGSEQPTQYETRFITKDKKSIPVEVSVTDTTWHGGNASTVVARDISQRLKNREKLKASHDEMERRVILRTEKLQQEISNHKLTENILFQSEQKLHSILNTIADAIITIDINGVISNFNPATEIMFDYSAAELKGSNIAMLMPDDQAAVHSDYMEGHLTTGQSRVLGKRRQLYGKRKNGETFPIEITINDFTIDGSRFFSGVIRDTTERVRSETELKASQLRLSHLLTSTPVVIYTCKTTGDYSATYISENITEMMGYYPHQFTEDPSFWSEGIHPDDREMIFENLETVFETGHHEHEYRFKVCDGSYIWVHDELRLTYDQNGKPLEIVGYWADISARKKAEIAGIEARKDAERANSAKSDFLSRMSHEFRTPLNVILGFSQLLVSDKKDSLSEQQKENIDHIVKAGKHLLELINEILYLAQIEAGKVTLAMTEIPLAETINESIKLIQPLADNQDITISSQMDNLDDAYIYADPVRFREVLLNLLSNAVKYNRIKGTVSINCKVINKTQIQISVTDSGPGLSPEQQQLLFKPFERINAENTQQDGTGIGLLISQRLTEAMQGTIGFNSTAGTGSTFWIELDLVSAPDITSNTREEKPSCKDKEIEQREITSSENKEYSVLCVDDNDSGLQLVQQLLKLRPSIKTYASNSPEKGLDIAKTEIPDLILLDINMPNMNGYEVLEHLKNNQKTNHIPVIAISANAMPDDVERGKNSEFREYLTKPIDADKFYSAIDSILTNEEDTQAIQ